MSKEQEEDDNFKNLKKIEQQAAENLHVLGRRQDKANKIRVILAQSLSECGEGKQFEEVRKAIGVAMSKIDQSSKKTFHKAGINQQMVELAKTKQEQWWKNIQSGLGIKPTLDIPEIKKEMKNDFESTD